jgi:HEAT repeat protein
MERTIASPTGEGSGPGDGTALEFYIARLSDENEGIRWKAAESLGRLGDPAAVQPLIDTLWDDDFRVRIKAAWALGKIGDPQAIPPLQRLYRIENENVREIIEKAMNEIKHRMSGE